MSGDTPKSAFCEMISHKMCRQTIYIHKMTFGVAVAVPVPFERSHILATLQYEYESYNTNQIC